jgi:hypothetical protein
MLIAYLIVEEAESPDSKEIVEMIANNIDEIVSKFDIRVIQATIDDIKPEWEIHKLPCLHIENENFLNKKEITQILKSGVIPAINHDDPIAEAMRELQQMNDEDRVKQIYEENKAENIDNERSQKMMAYMNRHPKQPQGIQPGAQQEANVTNIPQERDEESIDTDEHLRRLLSGDQ